MRLTRDLESLFSQTRRTPIDRSVCFTGRRISNELTSVCRNARLETLAIARVAQIPGIYSLGTLLG